MTKKTIASVIEKYKVQETHPELYKEICELVPSVGSKTLDTLKENKNESFGEKKLPSSIHNFLSVKGKPTERTTSRSKSPLGYNSKTSPRGESESGNNISCKSIKKSDISYNSSKSKSRLKMISGGTEKPIDNKSINLGPKSSVPALNELNHISAPHPPINTPSNLASENPSNMAYSNFLKKLSNVKSSKKDSLDRSKDKDKEQKSLHLRALSQFDSNKENDPKSVNLPTLAPKTPSQLASSKSQKSLFTADRLDKDYSVSQMPFHSKRSEDRRVEPVNLLAEKEKLVISDTKDNSKDINRKETPKDELIQDEPLSSKNIFHNIPFIQSKDTMGYKIEALKFYLERKMGLATLLSVYQSLVDASDEAGHRSNELPIMTSDQEKFVPFVHQLVFCELNYFEN